MDLARTVHWNRFIKTTFIILIFAILDNSHWLLANHASSDGGEYRNLKLPEPFHPFYNHYNTSLNLDLNYFNTSLEDARSSGFAGRDLGLLILGFIAKLCLFAFSYFKLICLCMFVSVLFLLLCPLLPLLIPALLLFLLAAVALSITIPIAAVMGTPGAGTGVGGGDLTVISSGAGIPPNFVSIPA